MRDITIHDTDEIVSAYRTGNDNGDGYPLGPENYDVANLADDAGMPLHHMEDGLAIYWQDGSDKAVVVGDIYGPWVVDVEVGTSA